MISLATSDRLCRWLKAGDDDARPQCPSAALHDPPAARNHHHYDTRPACNSPSPLARRRSGRITAARCATPAPQNPIAPAEPGAPLPALSFPGGFRTPALGPRGQLRHGPASETRHINCRPQRTLKALLTDLVRGCPGSSCDAAVRRLRAATAPRIQRLRRSGRHSFSPMSPAPGTVRAMGISVVGDRQNTSARKPRTFRACSYALLLPIRGSAVAFTWRPRS